MSKIELTKTQKEKFSKEFLQLYLSRGFGNMPKREIDVLIFHLLQKQNVLDSKSIHLTAMQLRTTPAKVKSLLYENALRFPDETDTFDESYFKQKLRNYFINDAIYKIRKEDNWVYIQIDNPIVLDALKAIAKNNKEVIDSSFSSEIVKISTDGFALILGELIDEEKKKEIEKEIKKTFKSKGVMSIRSLGDKALTGFMNEGIKKAPGLIKGFTSSLLNGDLTRVFTEFSQYIS